MADNDTPTLNPALTRPFEERIMRMRNEAGNVAPRTGIWIIGHIESVDEDYTDRIFNMYNLFLQDDINEEPVLKQNIYRYISLLTKPGYNILEQSRPEDLTRQQPAEGGKFQKNYYTVSDDFPTAWVYYDVPREPMLYEELIEPIPDILLNPWDYEPEGDESYIDSDELDL